MWGALNCWVAGRLAASFIVLTNAFPLSSAEGKDFGSQPTAALLGDLSGRHQGSVLASGRFPRRPLIFQRRLKREYLFCCDLQPLQRESPFRPSELDHLAEAFCSCRHGRVIGSTRRRELPQGSTPRSCSRDRSLSLDNLANLQL